MVQDKVINVTSPFFPPKEEFEQLVSDIWESGYLTNNAQFVQELERRFDADLGVRNFIAVNNGTTALQLAIKCLGLSGEIIVPAFTWVATLSAIKWEGCKPVFCDIDPNTLNIDTSKIESLVTENTVAIMPVHVFGNPCDVEKIEMISKKHGLKVIYDAAHAVGSTYKGKSLLNYGDISATSLHATKIINTAEGGGCATKDKKLTKKLKRLRSYGYDVKVEEPEDIVEDGINAKMSELNAALGIVNLRYFSKILLDRKDKYSEYLSLLKGNSKLSFQELNGSGVNHSYFPVIFAEEQVTLAIISKLKEKNYFPRRYFYPSINLFTNIVEYNKCEVSEDISRRILCLPLHYNMNKKHIQEICNIILSEI